MPVVIRLGFICLALLLLATGWGLFGSGALQEVLWLLLVIGGWGWIIAGSVIIMRKRIRAKTFGRLVRAVAGAVLVWAVLMGVFIAIDRLIVDLHGLGFAIIFAAVFAVCGVYTFFRLDRAPRTTTTPNPAQ